MDKQTLLLKAQNARRESKYVDFKAEFNVDSRGNWCELIKDIVAMANSGGGVILIGVGNNGVFSGFNVAPILNYDTANVTNKIFRYTNEHFSEFEIKEVERDGNRIAGLLVYSVSIPLVFVNPGTYDIGNGQQKTAFSRGTIYFRHGSKSEPCHSSDIRNSIEQELARIRKSWLGDIKKIVTAPLGQKVQVIQENKEHEETMYVPNAEVRVVNGVNGVPVTAISYDATHPYRQTELIGHVNERLSGNIINSYDILCVRKVHNVGENPNYYFRPRFGTPQYSDAFIDWLINQYEEDKQFFENTRKTVRNQNK